MIKGRSDHMLATFKVRRVSSLFVKEQGLVHKQEHFLKKGCCIFQKNQKTTPFHTTHVWVNQNLMKTQKHMKFMSMLNQQLAMYGTAMATAAHADAVAGSSFKLITFFGSVSSSFSFLLKHALLMRDIHLSTLEKEAWFLDEEQQNWRR